MSQFTVLGSGASSGVPWLGCVLQDSEGGVKCGCCAVCTDALSSAASPNRRGNVSCALRFQRPDGGGLYNVVVDCGKTYRDTVTRVWPTLQPPLRRMHALLLTHPHADAYGGLDCLRESSPSFPVHVYCHAPTMQRIKESYPYLVRGNAPPPPAEGSSCCCSSSDTPATAATAAAAPLPRTYIADLVFHLIKPWEPFVLEGSGGQVVTPIPLEHSGRMGVPAYSEEDSCLGFEFGAYLQQQPSSSQQLAEGGGAAAAAQPLPLPQPLPLDGRGLPALPPFHGDRVLWVSDVRALSAEVRAFLAARPISILCLDALGHLSYPTHFSLSQALACAADLAGPGSCSSGSGTRVLLVGMNHDVHHQSECAKMQAWAAGARLARPLGGARPLVWETEEGGSGAAAGGAEVEEAPFLPLGLASVTLAHDGLSHAISLSHAIASLEALAAEVGALRAAAAALCAADTAHDYTAAAIATERAMAEQRTRLEEQHLPPASGQRVALRRREDYMGCLVPQYNGYAGTPSEGVRGAWRFERSDGRRL